MVNAGQFGSSEDLPIRSVQHTTGRDESHTLTHAPTTVKPVTIHLSFAQLWNISFAFFGIQVGWGLQMANASAIFEFLGASAEQLPLLWLAAPVSGLVIQPLVGYMSDRTYHPIGRRRPYFLCGALLSSLALIVMPNSPSLWIATGSLWLLDAAANI